ncbi:MAG TPA: hypothetical protein VIG99_13675 [Myxococcaceae bacterium]|jgi:hypothetical protein
MRRLRAVVVGLAVVPLWVNAAELTRVASSFDEGHPFGLFIDLGFDRTQRLESITRDKHVAQPDPPNEIRLQAEPELRYAGIDYRLNLDVHAGLWHDVEFHFGIPLIFLQTEEWWLSSRTTEAQSAVLNSCVRADGSLVNPNCPTTGVGAVPIYPTTSTSPLTPKISTTTGAPQVFRGGFGNMRFGMSWAAFNQLRDDTKPMWLVGIEYEAPTADPLDPTKPTTNGAHGAIGDRIHKYQLWSALSRRIGSADPYVKVNVTLPYHGPGWYSNCDHPDPTLMGTPANCNLTEWTRDTTGILYPYNAEIVAGSEFIVFDQPAKHQKFTLDARAHARYVSPGRYYNELSGLTQKLMYSGDYLQVGGSIALLAGVANYLTLRARGVLSYETDHVLSNEPLGRDLNSNDVIDYQTNPAEVNPNFDYRYDLVARQFRATATWVFSVQVSASFNF